MHGERGLLRPAVEPRRERRGARHRPAQAGACEATVRGDRDLLLPGIVPFGGEHGQSGPHRQRQLAVAVEHGGRVERRDLADAGRAAGVQRQPQVVCRALPGRGKPALGGDRSAVAQQLGEGAGAPRRGVARPRRVEHRERDPQATEVAVDRPRVRREIARHHPDPLRRHAGVEQGPDPARHLAHLRLRPGRAEDVEAPRRRRGCGSPLHRRRTLQPLREAPAEDNAGIGARRRGRVGGLVQVHRCAAVPHQRLDEVRSNPGGVGETVHQDRPRRQRPGGVAREQPGRPPQHVTGEVESPRIERECGAGRDADERLGARPLGRVRVAGEQLADRLGAFRDETGVEQVAHRRRDRQLAVLESGDERRQRGRAPGEAAGKHAEEQPPGPAARAAALRHSGCQAVQRQDLDPRGRPPACGHHGSRQVEAERTGGDDDDDRLRQQAGVGLRLGQQGRDVGQQERLGGARAAGDLDAPADPRAWALLAHPASHAACEHGGRAPVNATAVTNRRDQLEGCGSAGGARLPSATAASISARAWRQSSSEPSRIRTLRPIT